jgi:hypothetical protein
MKHLAAVLAVCLASATAFAQAKTLVVKGADGKIAAGAAKAWTAGKDSVSFVLADGVDGAAVAKLLSERLAGAKITFADGKLDIAGIPAPALLDQLTNVSLGEGDELADLAGLGSVVAMGAPEGGGSIRASKPSGSARPRIIADHDPNERITCQVVEVKRGAFPAVTLKLKVKKSAKSGPLKDQLKVGKTLEGEVVLAGDSGAIDFNSAASQRNLAAFYLAPGDNVTIHAVPLEGAALELDWVERATAK